MTSVDYHYCRSWFRAKKRATEMISADAARTMHGEGTTYCALAGSAAAPWCFVEVTRNSVGVGFLDDRLRERLSYSFLREAGDRLFLAMATWREFHGDADAVASGTTYIFDPAGTVKMRKEVFVPAHVLETGESTADVGANWEDFPSFGRYESLTAIERVLPGGVSDLSSSHPRTDVMKI